MSQDRIEIKSLKHNNGNKNQIMTFFSPIFLLSPFSPFFLSFFRFLLFLLFIFSFSFFCLRKCASLCAPPSEVKERCTCPCAPPPQLRACLDLIKVFRILFHKFSRFTVRHNILEFRSTNYSFIKPYLHRSCLCGGGA